MRMQRERGGERIARLAARAFAEQDLGEMQHRGKVARLELEGALDIAEAFGVAAEEVIERRALVPGLGIERRAAQEQRKARLGDVVAPRRDIAGRGVERRGGGAMRMVHPHAPDAIFGVGRLDAGTGSQAAEELRERGQIAHRAPLAARRDQTEDFAWRAGHLKILMEIARGCLDRKSTRLNSSHVEISYAVFCLKKKKKKKKKMN